MHEAVVTSVLLCSVKELAHNQWVIGTFGKLACNPDGYTFTDQDGKVHKWVFVYDIDSVASSIAIGFALRPFVVECGIDTQDTVAVTAGQLAQCIEAANPTIRVTKQGEHGIFSLNTSLGAPDAWLTLDTTRAVFYKNCIETLNGVYPNNYSFLSLTAEIPISFIVYVCDFVVAAAYCDQYDSGDQHPTAHSYGIQSLAKYHAECPGGRSATPTLPQGWLM